MEPFEYKGELYILALAKDNKPCDHCVLRKECEYVIDEDIMMLCGCEFCTEPWYIIKYIKD